MINQSLLTDEAIRESRHANLEHWIGHALEALCAGDVVEHIAAVDLAYEIAHYREGPRT